MKKTLLFACLLISGPIAARSQEAHKKVLDEIRNLEREYGGHLGFMAKNQNKRCQGTNHYSKDSHVIGIWHCHEGIRAWQDYDDQH